MAVDFPSNPQHGDVFGTWTYDSTVPGWRSTPDVATGMPAGSIMVWGTDTAPTNWLICNGAAVSRTTYASLFAAIGVTYGVGDGATTFNLPDLRGKVAVGKDATQSEFDLLGETGGNKTTAKYGDGTTTGYGATYSSSLGSGDATGSNLPPYQVVNYIIKFSAGISAGDSDLATRVGVIENKFNTGQNDTPAGTITQFGGSTIPTNWLLCDGSAVSRATWPSLFTAIGTTYGAGDGSTTFNLPDIPAGDAAGIVSQLRINSQVTVTTTLTDLSGITLSPTLKAGRTYRITFSSPNLNMSGTGRSRFDIMANSTLVARDYVGVAASIGGVAFNIQATYVPPTDGTYTIKVAGMVDAGTATTMTVYADGNSTTLLTIEDMGEAAGSALRPKSIIKATAGIATNESAFVTRVGAVETRIGAEEVLSAGLNRSGLVPAFPSSVTAVGSGTASVASDGLITVSGVQAIAIDGVFSSLYNNYRIVISDVACSSASVFALQLRQTGTTDSAGHYSYAGKLMNSTGTSNGDHRALDANQFGFMWTSAAASSPNQYASLDIYKPKSTTSTGITAQSSGLDGGNRVMWVNASCENWYQVSFDGLYFTNQGGTFSGKFKVYGYR